MDKNYLIKMLLFLSIIYLIFAFFPDVCGIRILPTGGWDWLNFIGVIWATYFALEGVIKTIESTKKLERDNRIKSIVPIISLDIKPSLETTTGICFFRKINEIDGLLKNNYYYITKDNKPPTYFNKGLIIALSNIGLSAAFKIEIVLHNLGSIPDIFTNGLSFSEKDYFDNVVIDKNFEYLNPKGVKVSDEWCIVDPFNLGANANNHINLVLDTKEIYSSFYMIAEVRFKDIDGNGYNQLFYLDFNNKITGESVDISPITHLYNGYKHEF